jgi:hypothetical protein
MTSVARPNAGVAASFRPARGDEGVDLVTADHGYAGANLTTIPIDDKRPFNAYEPVVDLI